MMMMVMMMMVMMMMVVVMVIVMLYSWKCWYFTLLGIPYSVTKYFLQPNINGCISSSSLLVESFGRFQ